MSSEHAMPHGWGDWCPRGAFDPAVLARKLAVAFEMAGGRESGSGDDAYGHGGPGSGPGGRSGGRSGGPGGSGEHGSRGHRGWWHGPGGPWSGGPGHLGRMLFGGHGGPGPPWTQGAKARRGDVRLAMLALLAEGPRNGYQMIQQVAERSGGAWKPSPGAVYPALQQLADEGLVRAEESEGRRTFSLTAQGEDYVAEHRAEIDRVFAAMSADEVPSDIGGLFDLITQSGTALMQIVQTGTEQQREQAHRVLSDTRRRLYRILAEDDIDGERSGDEPDR